MNPLKLLRLSFRLGCGDYDKMRSVYLSYFARVSDGDREWLEDEFPERITRWRSKYIFKMLRKSQFRSVPNFIGEIDDDDRYWILENYGPRVAREAIEFDDDSSVSSISIVHGCARFGDDEMRSRITSIKVRRVESRINSLKDVHAFRGIADSVYDYVMVGCPPSANFIEQLLKVFQSKEYYSLKYDRDDKWIDAPHRSEVDTMVRLALFKTVRMCVHKKYPLTEYALLWLKQWEPEMPVASLERELTFFDQQNRYTRV